MEQNGGGGDWFTAWGPLIGVVIGAILGALGQVVASNLSHRRQLENERREWRRSSYVLALEAVTQMFGAKTNLRLVRSETARDAEHAKELTERSRSASEAHTIANRRLLDAQIRVGLYAPEPVQHALDGLVAALRRVKVSQELDWSEVEAWNAKTVTAMRADLGLKGTLTTLPSEMKQGLPDTPSRTPET